MAISYLIQNNGFAKGIRILSAAIAVLSLVAFVFGGPPPQTKRSPLDNVRSIRCWVRCEALRNRAFLCFTAGIAAVFFGYSPLLFHVNVWAEQEKLKMVWFLVIMNGYLLILAQSCSAAFTNLLAVAASLVGSAVQLLQVPGRDG